MRDHDDKSVFGNFLEKLHNLNTCLGVECARRLVCKKNIRLVYKRSCDSNSLHLTARKLIRSLIYLCSESDLFQSRLGTLFSLRTRYTADSQRKLDIREKILMRNEIVALENKADCVVTVSVPVSVLILFCGNGIDYEIAVIISVKTADNV